MTTSRMYFGMRYSSAGMKDRDGYDLPDIVHQGWLRFDDDGTVEGFEFSEGGTGRCMADPQLRGQYTVEGNWIRFSLERLKEPDPLDPPEEDAYWWPPTSNSLFPAGDYEAKFHDGALMLKEDGQFDSDRALALRSIEGDSFLPDAGSLPVPPPPPPPPAPSAAELARDRDRDAAAAEARIAETERELEVLEGIQLADRVASLVRRTQWGLILNVIGVIIAGTGIAIDEGDGRVLITFIVLSLVFFIPGFILSPSRKEVGELKEVVSTLAAKSLGNAIVNVIAFVLLCVFIYKANDIYGWTKEKAVDAYEAGKDFLTSDEEKAAQLVDEAEKKLASLKSPGATAERLKLESELARQLAEIAESPAARQQAIDAYGRAAQTASTRDDLRTLEELIDEQIALDRKGASR